MNYFEGYMEGRAAGEQDCVDGVDRQKPRRIPHCSDSSDEGPNCADDV